MKLILNFDNRIFMIDRNRTGELQEEFSVLGSTGNVYNVVVDHKPRCDCPDAMKGNHCKHIVRGRRSCIVLC